MRLEEFMPADDPLRKTRLWYRRMRSQTLSIDQRRGKRPKPRKTNPAEAGLVQRHA